MEETDWVHVPRDARELFVVLNGCEWRKRTNGAMNFDPVKFKASTHFLHKHTYILLV